jgi:alkylhydroperoxidase/carboxymuconolactone decarboxylase family protein YurZ
MERYNQTSGEAEGAMQDEEQFSSEIKDPRKEVFIEKLHEGQSVSAAARAIGIAVSTGEVWALAASIRVNKRPSLILGETKKRMMAALKRGASKEKVAEIGGVSISSVTRLLRTESGLQSAWHQAQVETRRQTARRAWQRIVSRNPRAGVKALRLLEPAEYAWLYRNDRAWLDRQIESQPCAPNQGGMPVDWVSRDAALAHQVEKTGLQLAEQFPGKRIKLWQLYQAVPDLKAKLERMDRLPQTHAVIQRMCRTRNENGTKTFALPGC